MVTLTPHESSPVSLSPSTEMSNGTRDTQRQSLLRESIRCGTRIKKQPNHLKDYVT